MVKTRTIISFGFDAVKVPITVGAFSLKVRRLTVRPIYS